MAAEPTGADGDGVTAAMTRAAVHWLGGWAAGGRAVGAALGLTARDRGPRDLPGTPGTAYEAPDWSFTRSVETRPAIGVGAVVTFTKRITDEDVRAFAARSGDTNRLHLDDEFAAQTRFGRRIAHGTLVSGLISAALARYPGVTIYLSQDLTYLGPVDLDERVTARCEVVEDLGEGRYRINTVVVGADGEVAVDGEAVVLIDELPAIAQSDEA